MKIRMELPLIRFVEPERVFMSARHISTDQHLEVNNLNRLIFPKPGNSNVLELLKIVN